MRISSVLILLASPAFAGDKFGDWQTGDLIFHESGSGQAAAIRVATGSPYTHMGIINVTPGGVYVIEAGKVVGATPVDKFISRGNSSTFAVYRPTGLALEEKQAVVAASEAYFGLPYDLFFRPEEDAIYCSELPFHAFREIGRDIGTVQVLGDLAIDLPEAREMFMSRWQQHPDCRGIDQDACWAVIQSQEIVTPVSIAEDPAVKLVFTNMIP